MRKKKYVIWIDDSDCPGGLDWDLGARGMAKVFSKQSGIAKRKATIILEDCPKKAVVPKKQKQ